MKKPINEITKLKRLAGLITESEYQESMINEATLKDLIEPLGTKLESMGYEVEYDRGFGFMNISGYKILPDKSILRVYISPSEEELQQKNYGGNPDEFSTVDVSFTHWTTEVTKKLFGLYKSKKLVSRNLPDESGTNIDLGIGMFDIPVDQSVEKIIAMVKKAEAKTSGGQTEPTELNENLSPEAFEMMDARVNRNHVLSLLAAAEGIMGDLSAEGFEVEDIRDYINQIIVNDI